MANPDDVVSSESPLPDPVYDEKTQQGSSQQVEEVEGAMKKEPLSWHAILAVISLCFVYNSYLFTLVMPAVILAFINEDLGPSPDLPWIPIVWNLGGAIVVTIGGRLTDVFGRRWFMITGAIIAAIGALIGVTGQSIPQMIAAGVIMGFGGGFQEIVFACVQEIVPNNWRLQILGCLDLSNMFAMFSPLIGYAFITYSPLGWRACYWYMFAMEAGTAVMCYFFYKPPTFHTKHSEDGKTKLQLLKEIDYLGLFIFTAACVLFLVGLNWGGRRFPWNSAGVIAPLVLAGVLFIVLGLYEVYVPLKYPILPPRLFAKWRDFTALTLCSFFGGMMYYSLNVLWPRQSAALFVSQTDSTITRGLYANMPSFGTMLAGFITVSIVPRLGHERWQLVTFLCIQTAMIGSMSTIGPGDRAQAIASVIIIPAMTAPPHFLSFAMVSFGLDDQTDIGVAQGVLGTARLIGGAISTAVYTAVQNNRFNELIEPLVSEAAEDAGYTGSTASIVAAARNATMAAYEEIGASSSVVTAVRAALRETNAQSFQRVFQIAVAFGGLTVLIAMTTKTIPKRLKNRDVSAMLETERPATESKAI